MGETQTMTARTGQGAVRDLQGKYLTFILGGEEYGVDIMKVREIIGVMDITSLPQTPNFIKGVINLRGRVIPVLDLRLKFGLEEAARTQETCIIVVDMERITMGVIVDTVSEVLDIHENEVEPAPSFGSGVDTRFILGMAKIKGKVKILLDIETVLTAADFEAIEDTALAA